MRRQNASTRAVTYKLLLSFDVVVFSAAQSLRSDVYHFCCVGEIEDVTFDATSLLVRYHVRILMKYLISTLVLVYSFVTITSSLGSFPVDYLCIAIP
jgi:hypothetical protein